MGNVDQAKRKMSCQIVALFFGYQFYNLVTIVMIHQMSLQQTNTLGLKVGWQDDNLWWMKNFQVLG